MEKAGRSYITFNKVRLVLFIRTYTHYFIANYLKKKYKIGENLNPKELRKRYFNKSTIPEISRLSKTLHLNYSLLWNSIFLHKNYELNTKIKNRERIRIFIFVETELISLFIAKQNTSEFRDPDYESELAILSLAIERAVGNDLKDIEDDFTFEQKLFELKKKYTYWYYKTAYVYKLPTLRITPFILRLISS